MKYCKIHKKVMTRTPSGEWICIDCHIQQAEDDFLDEYGVEITDLRTGEQIELSWREILEMGKRDGKDQ